MGLFLLKSQKPKGFHEARYKLLKACVHRYNCIGPIFGSGAYEITERYSEDPADPNKFKSHRFDIWHVTGDKKKKVLSFFVSYDKYDTTEYLAIDKYVDGNWTDVIYDGINDDSLAKYGS
jgi:hypothetical protein